MREIACKVVGISDGDTLTCLQDRKQIKVRLLHIDAPESSQPFGNRAKQSLATLVFKKQVILKASGYDKYGRLLAEVYENGNNINLQLVQQGMAWAYVKTQPIYLQAQEKAKAQRIGLWQDSNPISPAEWRKVKGTGYNNHNNAPQAVEKPQSFTNITCQAKLSCAKFRDFETANRYFQQCNARYMDGNNDGIPCNKLYRKMMSGQ